jgi:hypothetical protein
LIRGRRPRAEDGAATEPKSVPVTRASAIATDGFASEAEAASWLERCRSNAGEREGLVEQGLRVVNRAIHAHRLAAADPHVHEVHLSQAQLARIGYGTGDELVGGRWSAAYVLPPPGRKARSRELIEPQQELARIVGGRRREFASEDLALRARLDLEHGRTAQAALQLEAALSALSTELESDQGPSAPARALLDRRDELRGIAADAHRQALDGNRRETLSDVMAELERLLRRRRHAPEQR